MNPEIDSILKQMEKLAPPRDVHPSNPDIIHTYQSLYTSRLFVLLAKDAEEQAGRMEKQVVELVGIAAEQKRLAAKLDVQTDRLISLTVWLRGLTVALLILTLMLCLFETFHFIENRKDSTQFAPYVQTTNQAAK